MVKKTYKVINANNKKIKVKNNPKLNNSAKFTSFGFPLSVKKTNKKQTTTNTRNQVSVTENLTNYNQIQKNLRNHAIKYGDEYCKKQLKTNLNVYKKFFFSHL